MIRKNGISVEEVEVPNTENNAAETVFAGGGEMGALMRRLDWAATPIGAVDQWPQSLRTAVSICLNSRFPMVIWWGKDLILLYNDAWRPILGNKHPQALGRPGQEVWAENWDVIGLQLNGVLETGQATWSDDLLLPALRYGYLEEAYFTYSYSPIFTETGQVGGAFTAVTETTRRVIGERQLDTLRELSTNALAEKSVERVCHILTTTLGNNPYDIPFALLYLINVNGDAAELISTAGIAVGTIASPKQIDLTDAAALWQLSKVLQSGRSLLIEPLDQYGPLPGGGWHEPPHRAFVLPLTKPTSNRSERPDLAGFLVLGISARRAFDQNYQSFFELIANSVATAIVNVQVYEQERQRAKALAELDQAKTTFFNNISHEFRTPLTLILGPAADALSDVEVPLPERQRQRLEILQRNGLRLLKLVNTLLDFARIEAGRVQAAFQPIDLAALTTELASVFRSTIEQAGLTFVVDCPPLPAPVLVDPDMWEKIVLNLLSNAFKFTFTGQISIRLEAVADRVELTVQDTGVGIPESALPHLFERFHRVGGMRARTDEGSGIGLSLVQELVKLHHGTIQVASQVNQGTTFTVSLPLGTAHLPAAETPRLSPTALGAAPYIEEALRWLPEADPTSVLRPAKLNSALELAIQPAAPAARIMLIDDNADMRDYVQRLLSQTYEVEAVGDGLSALHAIAQRLPDLIVTDVMMPNLSGFGLLQELRADPRTREIPIILLSARAGEEAQVEGLAAGADDYLIKPFSGRELLARVESNLKLAQLRRQSAQREQVLRAEAEAAKADLEAVLARIDDQFLALDHEWRYTYVNDQACAVIGIAKTDLIGKKIWEVFPDAVDSILDTELHRAVSDQVPVTFEYFYPHWSRWFENRAYPSPDGLTLLITDITERKQIEVMLAQQNTRLREQAQLLDLALDGIVVRDLNNVITFWNLAAEAMYGWNREEALGQCLHYLLQTQFPQPLATIEAELFQSGRWEGELTHTKRDGTTAVVMSRWALKRDEAGQPAAILEVNHDITGRKQTEEALRLSEDRYRTLANAVSQLMWINNAQGRIQFFNQRWIDYTGTALELNVELWREIIHPDDFESTLSTRTQSIQLAEAYEVECRLKRFDQTYRWHLARVVPLKDEQGRVLYWFGTATDIEEIKQVEAGQRFLSEASAMIASLDYKTMLTNIARLAVPFLADFCSFDLVTPEGQIQRVACHPRDAMPELDSAAVQLQVPSPMAQVHPVARALRRGQTEFVPQVTDAWMQSIALSPEQLQWMRDKGLQSWITVPLVARSRKLGALTFCKTTGCFTEADRALAEELARRSALALDNAQLYQQAQSANQIKDQFLAVLSHELRSPLNPILGWATLLLSKQPDDDLFVRGLQTIVRNAKLQTQLIDDLLDVSRILQGKLSLNVMPVELKGVIESAMETVRLATEAKKIDLRFEIETYQPEAAGSPGLTGAAQPLFVLGDPGRLQQVVWNLLSNAVKFTPTAGRIEIRLTTIACNLLFTAGEPKKTDLGQLTDCAQITVTDTGKGIQPEFLPYVFDYFRQADSSTTRNFGGLGLGLAIVRHLVELHGGTVQATSLGEGQGASFTVQLPLHQLENLQSRSSAAADVSSVASSRLEGLRVLVVDDDQDSLELVLLLLQRAGATVSATASAREALQLLKTTAVDVLISDIGMPEMDGYMLIQQIRTRPNLQTIAAIALTAYAGEINQQRAFAAGFQAHLAKPVEPAELIQTIMQLKALGNQS